jgi:hypothetical protein
MFSNKAARIEIVEIKEAWGFGVEDFFCEDFIGVENIFKLMLDFKYPVIINLLCFTF